MADRFDFMSIYEDETWTMKVANSEGYSEKIYAIVKKEVEESNFPNLEITEAEYVTGGLIFNKEATRMVKIKATKSNFQKFEIYYRVQTFGNVVLFTRMECMERGFFGTLSGKTGKELKNEIRIKCKNMAQYEEFVAIDSLANIIYENALMKMDANYKERKMLASK